MDTIMALVAGGGTLGLFLCIILGITELATLRTIRAPKPQSFANIQLAAKQTQTIFAPALGTLISGLFVSLSASFLYASFTEGKDSQKESLIGVLLFLAGAVALALTLRTILKDVGEPAKLAQDPFAIRAAACDFETNPRQAVLSPDTLAQQLEKWSRRRLAYTLGFSSERTSDRLDQALTQGSQKVGFWLAVILSFKIYYAALLLFPLKFFWPILGWLLYLTGIVWLAVVPAKLNFAASVRPWLVVGLFIILGTAAIFFFCVARGNRARLWHRVYDAAFLESRKAIDDARLVQAAVAHADATKERILTEIGVFLNDRTNARNTSDQTVFRLGKYRLIKH